MSWTLYKNNASSLKDE